MNTWCITKSGILRSGGICPGGNKSGQGESDSGFYVLGVSVMVVHVQDLFPVTGVSLDWKKAMSAQLEWWQIH